MMLVGYHPNDPQEQSPWLFLAEGKRPHRNNKQLKTARFAIYLIGRAEYITTRLNQESYAGSQLVRFQGNLQNVVQIGRELRYRQIQFRIPPWCVCFRCTQRCSKVME
jgi:hypothetical protein